MFEFRAFQNTQKSSKESILNQPEKRDQVCRRVSFDTKYLGMGSVLIKERTTDALPTGLMKKNTNDFVKND